ncbi:MAG: (2Fe-2S)-binding protein [Azoarcus sp.]|jgi:bacterioferritin-associated ferredoxin|nr:(2Fe-2S)-binding protein [Azoarcus sp.]
MYVCICQGVTERQIHEAARDGADCLRDLRRQLGVTDGCGRCAVCARACLTEGRAFRQGENASRAGSDAGGW